jgi:hypothetical protein
MRRAIDYHAGDRIVYRIQKHSVKPGPRAVNVYATPHGEEYLYEVDKYWMVQEQRPDGSLVAQTRQGKTHVIRANDPHLRLATWWERLWHQDRFPAAIDRLADEIPAQRYAPR